MPDQDPRDSVGALYRQYAPVVRRRILSFVDEQDADEVLHEVFLRAIEKFHTFRGDASPMTWLFRLTTNHCLNRLRSRSRRRELLSMRAPALRRRQIQEPDQEAHVFLEHLWRTLDEETAMIGIYYHLDDLTHREIARLVGVSPRTVGNRLERLNQHAQSLAALPKTAEETPR